MDLDLSVTRPPPPLTSFDGSKSRIPRSRILVFLSRRQTERTTRIFGDRSSIANYFVATFAPGGSTDTLLANALIAKHFFEIALCSCVLRTIWTADAHRDDGKRFVVRADEKLTRFVEHSNWRFPLATIVLDAQARFSQNSTSLNGSESGGGFSLLVLRLFRTRNKQRSTHRGKREEDP